MSKLQPRSLQPGVKLHDVIVVGGGPAGLRLAYRLASDGYDTVLFDDRTEIGKQKICTGIVGTEAFDRFHLPRSSILNEIRKLKFFSPLGNELEYLHPSLLAYVVDRTAFDRGLAESASRQGAKIRVGRREQQQHTGKGHDHGLGHQSQHKKTCHPQITPPPRLPHIPCVRPHRKQPKERTENILAFGYPGHRLHIKRVQAKQGGDHRTSPEGSRQPVKDSKQKQHIDQVKGQVGEMVSCWIQPEKLGVQHMGKPCQGMPVPGSWFQRCQSPHRVVPAEPLLDPRIARNVSNIIKTLKGDTSYTHVGCEDYAG